MRRTMRPRPSCTAFTCVLGRYCTNLQTCTFHIWSPWICSRAQSMSVYGVSNQRQQQGDEAGSNRGAPTFKAGGDDGVLT